MIFKCSECGKEYDNISAAMACEEACSKAVVAKEFEDSEENEKREWLIDYIIDHARLVDQDKKEAQAIVEQLKDATEAINEDKAVVQKAIKEFKENFSNYSITVNEDNNNYSVYFKELDEKEVLKKEKSYGGDIFNFDLKGELSNNFLNLMRGLFE